MSNQEIAAWLQAIAACLTLIVTIIYVIYTNRLVHSPHRTVLRLSKGKSENLNEYVVNVKNLGPAIATDVNVKSAIWNMKPIGYNEDPNKIPILINITKVYADGPTEIGFSEDMEFRVNGKLYYKIPLIVSWRTITGKKQNSVWKIDFEKDFELSRLGKLEQISYQVSWIVMCIKAPFIRNKAVWNMKKDNQV